MVKIDETGLLTFIHRIVKYRNSDFKRFNGDDIKTSYINLVTFRPVTPEFEGQRRPIHPSSISVNLCSLGDATARRCGISTEFCGAISIQFCFTCSLGGVTDVPRGLHSRLSHAYSCFYSLSLIPASGGGGKMTPSSFLPLYLWNCIRYTAMHFWNIVQDSEGYLSPYKVLSHLYQKCGHDGMKPEIRRFRKSAKSRMHDCKSHDYKQQTLSSTTFIFSWASGLNLLLAWFLDVNIHCYLRPRKHVSCLCKFAYILYLSEVITTSGFERDRDAILVIWRRHVPHDVVSSFIDFMDTYNRSRGIRN